MNWRNIIKAIKCPECKQGELKMTFYKKGRSGYTGQKNRTVMECNKCGHKEVFE
tara:strand:+ start:59 stop:220 length:162 start_codon:yes stop_codon:yes gene_type:complete